MTETNHETHTFRIFFTMPPGDVEAQIRTLYENGCDDSGLMGPGTDGTFIAEFDRETASFADAVISAIGDLRKAVPGLRVLRVEPNDIISIAEIARRTGRTDQSVRLLIAGKRGPGGFPESLGLLNEKTRVWRWSDVASWFAKAMGQPPDRYEEAVFLAALNSAIQLQSAAEQLADHPEQLKAVASLLPSSRDFQPRRRKASEAPRAA